MFKTYYYDKLSSRLVPVHVLGNRAQPPEFVFDRRKKLQLSESLSSGMDACVSFK